MNKLDIQRYDIRFAEEGQYAFRIIIPNYDSNGQLNNFTSRALYDGMFPKYLGPTIQKNTLIGFELFINWKLPVVLVEGSFDAIAVKYNAIPLDGTYMTKALKTALIRHRPEVYVCLDEMAFEYSISICNILYSLGLAVNNVRLPIDKDPGDYSTGDIWDYIENNSERVTLKYLIENKMTYGS